MTKLLKCLLSALLLVFIIAFSALGVLAKSAEVPEHGLSIDLPDDYTLLNDETAEDNLYLIESLGYTVESFKNYLKSSDVNAAETLFLAINSNTKSQISLKTWSTEFSKKIEDFSHLDEDSLLKTAKELILTDNASYKSVLANGMNLLEVRLNDKDSGGDFCSVQYITVCNSNFYSLTFTFSGIIDEHKVQSAWDTLITLKINTEKEKAVWDVNSVLNMVLSCAVIIIAIFVAVIIIISIVKDIKKRRTDEYETSDYIARRK